MTEASSTDTRAGHRARLHPPPGPALDGSGTDGIDPKSTRAGSREVEAARAAPIPDDAVLRFGRGAPAAGPAPIRTAPPARRRRRRRRGGVTAGLLAGLVAAGVIAYLLSRAPDPMHVTGASVAPAAPPIGCDVTVDVVGTVQTNGRAGALDYQWLRSDGQATAVLSETVPADSSVVALHLQWTFAGKGTYPATATLRVLRPDRIDATSQFTYACR